MSLKEDLIAARVRVTALREAAEICRRGKEEWRGVADRLHDTLFSGMADAAAYCEGAILSKISDGALPPDEQTEGWPAYVPQVIEFPEAGHAQLVLEDTPVIHAEEMTVTALRRMGSPRGELLGFQWDLPAAPRSTKGAGE